jgi:hypothetical protein
MYTSPLFISLILIIFDLIFVKIEYLKTNNNRGYHDNTR